MKPFVFLMTFCLVCYSPLFARIRPDDYQHAVDLLNQELYDEAITVLQASLDEDPNQAPIYNMLGLIYLKQSESVQSAIGSLEQAIRIDPNYADAYFNLASVYAGPANRPELAAEFFRKTLEVDPKYVKAYFGLGWFTLTAQEKSEEASEYFKKAIAYFPDFAEAYYGLGLSYIQMGKAPMALDSVSQIRKLGREDLAAYLEAVLRGGKVSEMLKEEDASEPAVVEAPQASREIEDVSPPHPPSKEGEGPATGTTISESSGSGSPSENSNPFNLN